MTDDVCLSGMANSRETHEVASATARLLRSVGRRIGEEDPEKLESLRAIEAALAAAWLDAIDGLRSLGYTDGEIGSQLGVTKQAVSLRWSRSRTRATV